MSLSRFIRAYLNGPRYMGRMFYYKKGILWFLTLPVWWVYALLVQHLTLVGGILLFMTAAFATMVLEYNSVCAGGAMEFTMIALFCADVLVGFFMLTRVTVVRHLPEAIHAGETFEVAYTLSNPGRRRRAYALLIDSLPWPTSLAAGARRAFVPLLAPGARVTVWGQAVAARRGVFTLPAVRVDTSLPFNLWRWGWTLGHPEVLVVRPAYTRLEAIDVSFGVRYQPGGVSLASCVAASTEFAGCREYREGDNPRHIHWRSSARFGRLVVREFHEEYLYRTAVVLDTQMRTAAWGGRLSGARRGAFEAVVSLGAAVTEYLSRGEYIMELFAAGPEVYRFTSGRSLAYANNVLDILACLEPHGGHPLKELVPLIKDDLRRIGSAVLLFLQWDEERAALVAMLREAGVSVRPVVVCARRARLQYPAEVTVVTADDVLAGRCTRL